MNLDEPQSVLVFEFFAEIEAVGRASELAGQKVDRLVIIEKDPEFEDLSQEMDIWSLLMVEHVVGDDEDLKEMSEHLECRLLYVCASGLSWVRRPRLYWSNVGLEDHPSFQRSHHQLYEVIDFSQEL